MFRPLIDILLRRFKSLTLVFVFAILSSPVFAEGSQSTFWLWNFLGRLHPMIVHFPIGLLVVALIMEIIARKKKSYHDAIRSVVVMGAISSVMAVIVGLMLAENEDYGGAIKDIHQWTGIATMVLAGFTSYAYYKKSRQLQVFLLSLTVVGVTVAGHYGASLTHGEDYLTSVLPSGASDGASKSNYVLATTDGPLTEVQIQELNLQVRTILAHSCNSCHGAAKVKGDLRLDGKEHIFKGGESGPVVVPGDPGKSELLRRVLLPSNHKEYMPAKGKGLTKEEIAVLDYWIRKGAPWPEGELKSLFRVAELAPRLPEIPSAEGALTSPIDRFVNAYFKKNNVKWGEVVDDRTYIRRVYLDVIGLIPTPQEVDLFVQQTDADKREALVTRLLNRSHDYAQHWLSFWNDVLRNDYTGTGYITGGRFDISNWLYTSLETNKSYNSFVKEIINPDKSSQGFIRGIEWRGDINSSQTTQMQAAQNVAQVFLGINLKCASCHDSFIDDWKLKDAYGFANIFSEKALEINRCDIPTGEMAETRMIYPELGTIDSNAIPQEKLKQLADYLVQPKDGRLYRTLVNRIWAQTMGRGIVEPVDVMDKEPWSQDLLDWLAYTFETEGADLKKLLFQILTSKTYQLPSVGVKEPEVLMAPDYQFTGMVRRRLTGEQFTDAVSTALQPVYGDSMIVFKVFPEYLKNNIPFARAALVKNDAYLTALGRPSRETVSTSRTSQANLLQALELTNGELFNNTIQRAAKHYRTKYPDSRDLITEVYRNALGRLPQREEMGIAVEVLGAKPSEAGVQDFLWSITLHPEFQLIF